MPTLNPEDRILEEVGYFIGDIYEEIEASVSDQLAEYERTRQIGRWAILGGGIVAGWGTSEFVIESSKAGALIAFVGVATVITGALIKGFNELRHTLRANVSN